MKKILIGLLIAILGAVGACLSFLRPLLVSDDYLVLTSHEGRPIKGQLLRLIFSDTYYIHTPENPIARYKFISVSFSERSALMPIGLRAGWFGLYYVHADQMSGISLLDSKIEDSWKVTFQQDGVSCSNPSLAFSITKRTNVPK